VVKVEWGGNQSTGHPLTTTGLPTIHGHLAVRNRPAVLARWVVLATVGLCSQYWSLPEP